MTDNGNITIQRKLLQDIFGYWPLTITLFYNKYYDRKLPGFLNHNNIYVN
jgi:hypothetical protein